MLEQPFVQLLILLVAAVAVVAAFQRLRIPSSLGFSLPQIRSLRDQVLSLGPGRVVLTMAVVGLIGWLAGLTPAAAFVVGAFLAGMMLGETEFRHQVEAAIRPFRDMLLGLFFVGIGMLFDLTALPAIWPWAIAGAVGLMGMKTVLVMGLVRAAGADGFAAWRTGLLLAVGGEFGFEVPAMALAAGARGSPCRRVRLQAGNVLVLFGATGDVQRAEQSLHA